MGIYEQSSPRSHVTTASSGVSGVPTAAERCPFPAETKFGRYITLLFDQLKGIDRGQGIESLRKEANVLANFYRPGGIALSGIREIELTEADQKFMMGHPVGDTIRRVHLHYWLAETFAEAVKRFEILKGGTTDEQNHIERLCDILRRNGFSQYMVPESSEINGFKFLGDDQAIVLSREDRSFLYGGLSTSLRVRLQPVISDVRLTCVSRVRPLRPLYEGLLAVGLNGITDPHHMWEALALNLKPLLVINCLAKELVEMMGRQVLLVIEDNHSYHATYLPFFALEGISFFGPQGIEDTKSNRERIFIECEAALKLLKEALANNSPVPSVLIIDIELGRGRMNGLEFLEQAHNLYNTYKLRNKVILACVTSSHISRYQEHIGRLKQAGIIDCGYRKTNLHAKDLALLIGGHALRNSKEMSTQ